MVAFHSGGLLVYRVARYDLQASIKLANRDYRDRVGTNYKVSNLKST